MTRDQVARLVLGARSLEECCVAECALREWMEQHPNDVGMQEIGEGLAMMQDALSSSESCVEPARNGRTGNTPDEHPAEGASEADFGLSFEEEVRLTQAEFGWSEQEARAFVLSYRPGPNTQRI